VIAWQHPWALVALLLVPALAVFLVRAARSRQQALGEFIAGALLPTVVPDVDPRRRRVRAWLLLGAVLCLALALAGPQWGFRWQEVRREGIDLIVAIDTSRSMLATDLKPNRLERAKLAVRDLVSHLKGDRVGLVAFAGTAFLQCPLTLDYGAFGESLSAVEVGLIPKGGTALAAALDTSIAAFEGSEGKHQAVILITDGEDHEGKVEDAARKAAARGIRVFTVGIGTPEGELIPLETGGYVKDRGGQVVKSRLGESTLQQIATTTNGYYLATAGGAIDLAGLHRTHIDTLQKKELTSTLERRFENRFQFPLGLAILLLVVEPLIGDRRVAGRRGSPATAMLLALACLGWGWLDPYAREREGNRLFAEGKFDEAAAQYNEALVDQPDSPLLRYNLGATAYRQGKFEDALASFDKVPVPEDQPARRARTAYNQGNTLFRLGEATESADPKKTIEYWTTALVAYRRAMRADPVDPDPKLNHELVAKRLEELRKKLEEQQKEQEQNQDQQQNQEQQDQDQQQKDEQQQADQQEQPQNQKPEEPNQSKEPEQAKDQPSPSEPSEKDGGEDQAETATTGKEGDGEMSPREAAALLDAERNQEVRPDEIVRQLEGAAVAEPAEDW
jgi:Ca-activated chloride channel family protein